MILSNLLDFSTLDSMELQLSLAYLWFQKTIMCMLTWGIIFLTMYINDILLVRNNLELIETT